ncbi:MAG TPA: EVE domain-containing protein [Candidatus Thermoplasmatota archaeon]|nr:EVE domain-containing protein [Candidatus Thermoplasmatota archaeon]
MPAHWLLKSEPDVYSIDDLKRDKKTFWDGVRNYAARNHLQAMKAGDLGFFYHSNADPSGVVGIVEVAKTAYPDPTQFDPKDDHYDADSPKDAPRWFGVDVKFVEKLPQVVDLAAIKKEPSLKEMKLLKVSRLSVSPVTPAEWKTICRMGGKR